MMPCHAAGVIFLSLLSNAALAANPATIGNMTPQSVDQLAHPLAPAQAASLKAVCGRTMKLLSASPEYSGCVSSLSWSATEPDAHFPAMPAAPDAGPWRWDGFAAVSYRRRNAHEQKSCAALGFALSSEAFDTCVSDLEQTLFNLDNPQG